MAVIEKRRRQLYQDMTGSFIRSEVHVVNTSHLQSAANATAPLMGGTTYTIISLEPNQLTKWLPRGHRSRKQPRKKPSELEMIAFAASAPAAEAVENDAAEFAFGLLSHSLVPATISQERRSESPYAKRG